MKKLAYKWECDYLAPKMGLYTSERNVVDMMCHEPNVVSVCPNNNNKFIQIQGVRYEVYNRNNLPNPQYGSDPMWLVFNGRRLFINKSLPIKHCSIEQLARDINRIINFIKREQ